MANKHTHNSPRILEPRAGTTGFLPRLEPYEATIQTKAAREEGDWKIPQGLRFLKMFLVNYILPVYI